MPTGSNPIYEADACCENKNAQHPRCSMYIYPFTYIWVILRGSVGKHAIHGASENAKIEVSENSRRVGLPSDSIRFTGQVGLIFRKTNRCCDQCFLCALVVVPSDFCCLLFFCCCCCCCSLRSSCRFGCRCRCPFCCCCLAGYLVPNWMGMGAGAMNLAALTH